MNRFIKSFIQEEDGLGTVEIIIVIAVLVGVALLFRKQLITFVNGIIKKLFPDPASLEDNTGIQEKLVN